MNSIWRIIGLISLGAIAVGIGSGYFLYAANSDRRDLLTKLSVLEQQQKELEKQSEKLADEAEDHIRNAQEEQRKAQELIRLLQEEQQLIKQATLLKPSKATQSWKEALALDLGLTIKIPGNSTETISTSSLTVKVQDQFASWLQVERYSPDRLLALTPMDATSSDYLAVVNDTLLRGKRYVAPDNTVQYLLTAQKQASTTHALFATTQQGITEKILLDALSTIKTQ